MERSAWLKEQRRRAEELAKELGMTKLLDKKAKKIEEKIKEQQQQIEELRKELELLKNN